MIELIDFYADWCGPCQQMKPIIEELEKEYAGKVTFTEINVDTENALVGQYNIMSIPTYIIKKNGKVVDQLSGAQSKENLSSKLK